MANPFSWFLSILAFKSLMDTLTQVGTAISKMIAGSEATMVQQALISASNALVMKALSQGASDVANALAPVISKWLPLIAGVIAIFLAFKILVWIF